MDIRMRFLELQVVIFLNLSFDMKQVCNILQACWMSQL